MKNNPTENAQPLHTPIARSDPTKSILPWLGALGHTFYVIEPDDSENGKI